MSHCASISPSIYGSKAEMSYGRYANEAVTCPENHLEPRLLMLETEEREMRAWQRDLLTKSVVAMNHRTGDRYMLKDVRR